MQLPYIVKQLKSTRDDSGISVIFLNFTSMLNTYTKPILCCAFTRMGASKCSIVCVIIPKIILIEATTTPCIKAASDALRAIYMQRQVVQLPERYCNSQASVISNIDAICHTTCSISGKCKHINFTDLESHVITIYI